MSTEEAQVARYIIPLAKALAMHESTQQRRLTEEEVLEMRDTAPCILLGIEQARKFDEARAYHDINPENVWPEWNRVRCEHFGAGTLPSIALTLLLKKSQLSMVAELLEHRQWLYTVEEAEDEDDAEDENSNAVSRRGRDEIAALLEQGRSRMRPTLSEAHGDAIAGYELVVRAQGPSYVAKDAPVCSYDGLQVIAALLELGVDVVYCASAFLGHSAENWQKMAQYAESAFKQKGASTLGFWMPLFQAFVQFPIEQARQVFTCGMHLLGKPEVIVDLDVLEKVFQTDSEISEDARGYIESFCFFQLSQCPEGHFLPGNTFSVGADGPRLKAIWEPCTTFGEDDRRYNHLGQWRLVEAQ
jgi:hypothetical protein